MAVQPMPFAEHWTIPADLTRVAPMVQETASFLENRGVGPQPLFKAQLLLEEIVTNVVRHALHEDATRDVRIDVSLAGEEIRLVIEDDSIPFDPFSDAPAHDMTAPLQARSAGGMGVHLVRQMADDFVYERQSNANRVSLRVAVA